MRQRIGKKIYIYFFLFLIFGTVNNISIYNLDLFKVKKINIRGLEKNEAKKILINLEYLKLQNIFFLDNFAFNQIIKQNSLVEDFTIFKKYPSSLEVKIKKTKMLANIFKNGKNYFIGSNGKFISAEANKDDIPFIFGDLNIQEFLIFKNLVDQSNLNYLDIKKIYYYKSKRWDIELKDNILIKLQKKNLKESLELSHKILVSQNSKNIKLIDMRVIGQVIIND
tara:strand:+ start:1666 stop:2337 length:672 start_codon:yes stop_codon:yes gene_type:complete